MAWRSRTSQPHRVSPVFSIGPSRRRRLPGLDMQERTGRPGHLRLHLRTSTRARPGTSNCRRPRRPARASRRPGRQCYVSNAQGLRCAFAAFFDRRKKGRPSTPAKHGFVISAEENDQLRGAKVGGASQPTGGCDGKSRSLPPTMPNGQIGELQANVTGLVSTNRDQQHRGLTSSPRAPSILRNTVKRPRTTRRSGPSSNATPRRRTGDKTVYSGRHRRKDREVTGRRGVAQRIYAHADGRPCGTDIHAVRYRDYFFSTRGPRIESTVRSRGTTDTTSPNIDITWGAFVGPGWLRLGGMVATGRRQQALIRESTTCVTAGQRDRHYVDEGRPTTDPAAPGGKAGYYPVRRHRREPVLTIRRRHPKAISIFSYPGRQLISLVTSIFCRRRSANRRPARRGPLADAR